MIHFRCIITHNLFINSCGESTKDRTQGGCCFVQFVYFRAREVKVGWKVLRCINKSLPPHRLLKAKKNQITTISDKGGLLEDTTVKSQHAECLQNVMIKLHTAHRVICLVHFTLIYKDDIFMVNQWWMGYQLVSRFPLVMALACWGSALWIGSTCIYFESVRLIMSVFVFSSLCFPVLQSMHFRHNKYLLCFPNLFEISKVYVYVWISVLFRGCINTC